MGDPGQSPALSASFATSIEALGLIWLGDTWMGVGPQLVPNVADGYPTCAKIFLGRETYLAKLVLACCELQVK